VGRQICPCINRMTILTLFFQSNIVRKNTGVVVSTPLVVLRLLVHFKVIEIMTTYFSSLIASPIRSYLLDAHLFGSQVPYVPHPVEMSYRHLPVYCFDQPIQLTLSIVPCLP
jgi:hypothetical protein